MTLEITPGFLPQDGTELNPAVDLKRFVEETRISNIPKEAFVDAGEGMTFIVSATDAPATSSRIRGTLWFARGEGILYKWDNAYMSSDVTTSSLSTLKNLDDDVTPGFWVAMSDRKEFIAMYSGRQLDGGVTWFDPLLSYPLYHRLTITNEASHYSNGVGTHRPLINLFQGVDGKEGKGYIPVTDEFGSGYISGASAIFKVVDIGYTQMFVGSGSTGPSFLGVASGASDYQNFAARSLSDPYNAQSGDGIYEAWCTQSGHSLSGAVNVFFYGNPRRVPWGQVSVFA